MKKESFYEQRYAKLIDLFLDYYMSDEHDIGYKGMQGVIARPEAAGFKGDGRSDKVLNLAERVRKKHYLMPEAEAMLQFPMLTQAAAVLCHAFYKRRGWSIQKMADAWDLEVETFLTRKKRGRAMMILWLRDRYPMTTNGEMRAAG